MCTVLPAKYLLSYRKQSPSILHCTLDYSILCVYVDAEVYCGNLVSSAFIYLVLRWLCSTTRSGGGIAGLTTAIALSRLSAEKKDIQIDIYEAATKYSEIGAGVGMWRRPWKVMKLLGLDKALGKIAEIPAEEDKPGK